MKYNLFLLLAIISCISLSCLEPEIEADILIINGTVYNGVDQKPTTECVAIKDDLIIYIGDANAISINAKMTIDADGLIVSPGFIDPHTHADRDLINEETSHNQPFLFQGITTVVVGNDGDSFYPTSKYRDLYDKQGLGTNAVLLFGHGTIREQVMGRSDRKATDNEMFQMRELAHQEMNAGAFGISTGLFYAPGSYSNSQEVIEIAKTVSEHNGIYDTHLRDESSYTVGLIPAIEEAIEIGRQAKLPIHISHIKCLGVDVWHQSAEIINRIESAQLEGIEVTANQYPYDASATGLKSAVVPRWGESGGTDSLFIRFENNRLRPRILQETKVNIERRGGADKLLIVKCEDTAYVGKNLLEISEILNISPEETVFNVLKTGYVRVASFNMNSDDIHAFMKRDWVFTGSDGNTGHPRKYGTFPRKYHKYVVQDEVIDIGFFINQSTSKTADAIRIKKRGRLVEGYYADIIIFNPKTFKDKADYKNAFQLAEGLEYSIINGKLTIDKREYNGKLNGKVLTK
ncbi:N-acyl-D-amino-acid deacylase family protein [Gelidibacter mesophilus]|uniref:N-acyl-D-amino-acid deacylase family protein n=1 Tax=Gelidibacter mesophilus TaxID=169050 RepID=UPI0003F68358|nr:amidohydrolase family protein [Gelidibacter mesophilus]